MFCQKISDEYISNRTKVMELTVVKNGMLYSENAKIINMRLTISVTDMKPSVQPNHSGTSLKNRSSLFSRGYEFEGSTLGLAMALLRVYPEIGVGVYRKQKCQMTF